jgi:hypothetical protein
MQHDSGDKEDICSTFVDNAKLFTNWSYQVTVPQEKF